MKKKILIIFFVVILIILLIFVIREIQINNDKLIDKGNALSRDEAIELLDKGANYNNYYRCVETPNGKEEIYYKDDILACYINSNLYYWMNLSENEKEMIIIDDYQNKIASYVEDFKDTVFPIEHTQLGYYSTVYDTNIEYKYIGVTKLNNRDTIVVKTISKKDSLSNLEIKYYIDKETGVIVKRKEIEKFLFISTSVRELDRGIQFDTVTSEDVAKPDLTDYTIDTITSIPTLTIW